MVRDEEAGMAAKRAIKALTSSVRDIADSLDVSENTVTSWRIGRRSPSAANLRNLAELADDRADTLRGVARELRGMAGDNSGEASNE